MRTNQTDQNESIAFYEDFQLTEGGSKTVADLLVMSFNFPNALPIFPRLISKFYLNYYLVA